MRQIPRWALRHFAATAASTPRLLLGLTLVLGAGSGGCGSDDDSGAVDAGSDAGSLPQCKPADCAAIPLPAMQVCMVGTATFTCARNIDLRCTWLQPRCTTGNGGTDALVGPLGDGGVNPADAGADDDAAIDAGQDAASD